MFLRCVEHSSFGVEVAQEPMGGDQGQRLAGIGGVGEGLIGMVACRSLVAIRAVILGPEERTLGPAEHGSGPLQPAVVRLQPGSGGGEVLRIESYFGSDALQRKSRCDQNRSGLRFGSTRNDLRYHPAGPLMVALPGGELREPTACLLHCHGISTSDLGFRDLPRSLPAAR